MTSTHHDTVNRNAVVRLDGDTVGMRFRTSGGSIDMQNALDIDLVCSKVGAPGK